MLKEEARGPDWLGWLFDEILSLGKTTKLILGYHSVGKNIRLQKRGGRQHS